MDKINEHGTDYIDDDKFVTGHSPNKIWSYKSTTIRALGNIST